MARPKLNLDQRKCAPMGFRPTIKERSVILGNIYDSCLNQSEYLKQAALYSQIVVKRYNTLDPDLFFQLKGFLNNYNQRTNRMHLSGNIPPIPDPNAERVRQIVEYHLAHDR